MRKECQKFADKMIRDCRGWGDLCDRFAGLRVTIVGGAKISEPNLITPSRYLVDCNCHLISKGIEPDALFVVGESNAEWNAYLDCVELVVVPCTPHADDFFADHHIQTIVRYDRDCYRDANPRGIFFEWSNVLAKQLRTMPLTGIYAIRFFSLLPVESIAITGFDFYAGSNGGIIPYLINSHHLHPQAQWLARLCEADPRVQISKELGELINDPDSYQRTETLERHGYVFHRAIQ